MNEFEHRVLTDLSELKAHMRWLVGGGNEGKIQEIECKVQKHEAFLQRAGGIIAAIAALMMLIHFAFDYLRVFYRHAG